MAEEKAPAQNDDSRKRVPESEVKGENIIKCIGYLDVSFEYKNGQDVYEHHTFGTGTVISVDTSGNTYVLTSANNIRQRIYCCPKCKKYVYGKNDHDTCIAKDIKFKKGIMVKANNIYFVTKSNLSTYSILVSNEKKEKITEWHYYGDVNHIYPCDTENIYIDENNYQRFPMENGGYDLAVIRFMDKTKYYHELCENIELSPTKYVIKKSNEINIWGYPQNKLKEDPRPQDIVEEMPQPKEQSEHEKDDDDDNDDDDDDESEEESEEEESEEESDEDSDEESDNDQWDGLGYAVRPSTMNIEVIEEKEIEEEIKVEIIDYRTKIQPETVKQGGLYGMKCNDIGGKIIFRMNGASRKIYLAQDIIDVTLGQSGASVWIKKDNKVFICGVYTGGNEEHYGTIITDYIIRKIKDFVSIEMNTGNDDEEKNNFEYDGRKKVRDTTNRKDSIVKCIGLLESRYILNKSSSSRCTGTVIHIDGDKNIYILTIASGILASERQCRKCNEICIERKCSKCGANKTRLTGNYIDPDRIYFHRICNEKLWNKKYEFGETIKKYEVDKYKICNGFNIGKNANGIGGFDIAICVAKCMDKDGVDLYEICCPKIQLFRDLSLGGNKFFLYMYGYPEEKRNENKDYNYLYGTNNSTFFNTIKTVANDESNKVYIFNKEIFASNGQGGSCIYSYYENNVNSDRYLIYGIHVGAAKKKKNQRYATFLDIDNMEWIKKVFAQFNVKGIDDKFIDNIM